MDRPPPEQKEFQAGSQAWNRLWQLIFDRIQEAERQGSERQSKPKES